MWSEADVSIIHSHTHSLCRTIRMALVSQRTQLPGRMGRRAWWYFRPGGMAGQARWNGWPGSRRTIDHRVKNVPEGQRIFYYMEERCILTYYTNIILFTREYTP